MFDKKTDAKESFRGYNLQVLRAVRRLLQGISEKKLIYSAIECGDDVYEIKITDSDYKHTYEQDKLYSNGFSLNSIEVKKSICTFLNKWINIKDESIKFVFYTNVEIIKEKKVGLLQPPKRKCIELLIDVMNPSSWLGVKAYFINVIKDYYINIYNLSNSNITQIQSLTEEEWYTFASCIEWMFRSDDDIKLKKLLKGEIDILCTQYKVELDFADFLLAAIESDIRQGVIEKDFINQLVSTDRLINYFLNLSQYRFKESFELNDAWFTKRLQSSIERLSDRYSQKLDIEREETIFLDYMSGEICEREQDIINSKEYIEYKKLIDSPFLMITGEAGVGKSHFIAHSAVKYLNNYGKAVLILGQYCRSEEILKRKIINYLEIGCKCEFHDFLKHMDDWGRVTGRRSIIFFDAVNEGKNIEEEIEELALTIKQYENVGFVYSVRGNRKALKDDNKFLCINLDKLKKKDIEAFFIFYNIPLSYNYQDMDIFGLPLLLKMYCKLFECKEFNAEDGLYTIFPLYFKSVTKRILKKYPHDKTKADIVGTALEIYADLVIKNVDEYVNYRMLSVDIDKKLECYKLSFNVVDELLNENILVYNEKDDTLFVEFNLWSDYLIIKQILHNEEVKEFNNEEQLKKFFSPQSSYYNLLVIRDEMIAILLPDISCKYKKGGFELYYWASHLKYSDNVYLFLNSMYWRDLRKICAVGFSIYVNDNRVAINNSYDARFDVWDCIMQQCSRSTTRYFSVNYIYEMSQTWINEVMQRNWASYLNDKFFESDYFKRLIYSINNQLDLLDKDQIFNQLRVFTLFLYSLDSRIISRSMKTIAILMKKEPKVIINFLKSLNDSCKDETVYTKLVQIIFNITDYIDALTIAEIYRFLYKNLKLSFCIGKYKFLDLWYINGIRDIMVTRNLKIEDDYNFNITSFINHFVLQGLEKISRSDLEKYYREKNERETVYDEYIEYNDDEDGEFYYQCQNKIVNAFLNNFKENSYRFSSDFLVSEIAEPYKQMFLNNVLSVILKSEYSYMRYGFHDYWSNRSPHYQKKYAEKYEEIALDRVICKYLKTLLTNGIKLCNWVQKVVTYINEFTYVDCSIPEKVSNPFIISTEINTEIIKLQDKLENNDKWIPITFGSNLNYNLYIYIKGQTIDRNIREKILLEGIFYNELYRTKHFYKTVEFTNTNEQVLIEYLWDYDPFTRLTLLHPKIIKN